MNTLVDSGVGYAALPSDDFAEELSRRLGGLDAARSDTEGGSRWSGDGSDAVDAGSAGSIPTFTRYLRSCRPRRAMRYWNWLQEETRRGMRSVRSRRAKMIPALIMVGAGCVTLVWCMAVWVSMLNLYRGAQPCDQPTLTYFMAVDLVLNVAPCVLFGFQSPTTLRLLWAGRSCGLWQV